MLEQHTVHTSLFRPVLFAGAEPAAVVVEGLAAGGLLLGVGFHVATIGLAIFYVTVVHAVMVRLASDDPEISQLYIRSLSGRDYYPAHARLTARELDVRPSIPSVR
jgi:type IV secretory pathway TrbD component